MHFLSVLLSAAVVSMCLVGAITAFEVLNNLLAEKLGFATADTLKMIWAGTLFLIWVGVAFFTKEEEEEEKEPQ